MKGRLLGLTGVCDCCGLSEMSSSACAVTGWVLPQRRGRSAVTRLKSREGRKKHLPPFGCKNWGYEWHRFGRSLHAKEPVGRNQLTVSQSSASYKGWPASKPGVWARAVYGLLLLFTFAIFSFHYQGLFFLSSGALVRIYKDRWRQRSRFYPSPFKACLICWVFAVQRNTVNWVW